MQNISCEIIKEIQLLKEELNNIKEKEITDKNCILFKIIDKELSVLIKRYVNLNN